MSRDRPPGAPRRDKGDTAGPWWAHPRPFPGVRPTRTTLRTLHTIAFAALYGGHVYGVARDALHPALVATLVSGGSLAALEMWRSPTWPVQVRGLATAAKIVLTAAVAVWWDLAVPLLTAVLVIGAVVSHAPGRYRYYSIAHRRVVDTKPEAG